MALFHGVLPRYPHIYRASLCPQFFAATTSDFKLLRGPPCTRYPFMALLEIFAYLVLSISLFSQGACAQEVTVADSEICQRYGQSSAIVGPGLYYDGGWISKTAVKRSGDAARQKRLLAINLSESWKTSLVNLWEITQAPVQHLTENSVLFSDSNGYLHQYGYHQDIETNFKVWILNTQENPTWESSSPSTQGLEMRGDKLMFPIANAGYTQGGGYGYSVGGSNHGVISFSSSVMQYTLDPNNPGVANISAGFTEMSKGALVYVPFGFRGSLVSIGGLDSNDKEISPGDIAIFDIGSSKWYQQRATGSFPASLISGTAVVASAEDGSSFNIYVTNPLGMFILSIPSFTWYTVQSTGSNAPWLREKPSVNLAGKRQLLLYGGQNGKDCDSRAVYVFDMTSLTWKDSYDAGAADYEVPDTITDTIGGDGSGGATMNSPSSWDNSDLQSLFSDQTSPGQTSAKDLGPDSTQTSSPTSRSQASSTNEAIASQGTENPSSPTGYVFPFPTSGSGVSTGEGQSSGSTSGQNPNTPGKSAAPLPVIVGVSVGGAVLIAVVIGAICICRRRQRRPTSHSEVAQADFQEPAELHSNDKSIYELPSPADKQFAPIQAELADNQPLGRQYAHEVQGSQPTYGQHYHEMRGGQSLNRQYAHEIQDSQQTYGPLFNEALPYPRP